MLSTITSVISGRNKICDIDMLLIGTSSLFNNVMQVVLCADIGRFWKLEMERFDWSRAFWRQNSNGPIRSEYLCDVISLTNVLKRFLLTGSGDGRSQAQIIPWIRGFTNKIGGDALEG